MHKLSRHIAIRMTLILTIVALLIGTAVLFNNSRRIERLFNDQLINAGQLYSDIIQAELKEIAHLFNTMRALSLSGEPTTSDNVNTYKDTARILLKGSQIINNVFYFSSEDMEVKESFFAERLNNNDILFSGLEPLEILKDACHEVATETYKQSNTGTWLTVCSEEFSKRAYIEPYVENEVITGYIGTIVDLKELTLPKISYLGPSSQVFLLDHDGHVLTSDNKFNEAHLEDEIRQQLAMDMDLDLDDEQTHAKLSLENVKNRRIRINETNTIIGITKLDDDLYIGIAISQGGIDSQRSESIIVYLLSSLLYFFIVLIVSIWLMDREMKPFQVLKIFIRRIQEGNYSEALPEEYSQIKHEVGDIARSFEDLRMSLLSVFKNLEEEIDQHELTQRELGVMTEVLENSNEGVLILDEHRNIIYSNAAYSMISGYSSSELFGKHVSMFDSGGKDYRAEIVELLEEHGNWNGEINQLRKSGKLYPAALIIRLLRSEENEPKYYFVITEDMSEKQRSESDVIEIMNTDSKTGLPNASKMRLDIDKRIDQHENFALIYIGIDDFKSINEIYGFNAGDAVIVSLSEKLPLVAGENDNLYRIGGDEFAFLIDVDNLEDGIDKFIQQIQSIVRHPIRRNNISIYMTASMGISSYPRDADDGEAIVTAALSALNKAKLDARGFHYYFSKELREKSERRQMILSQLYEAVNQDEFSLMYQPKINAKDNKLVGMEALIRWENKSLGVVSPVEFIPVAEDSAIIEKIGRWVITRATEDLRIIHDLNHEELSLSVNLSGQQFKEESLFAWILESLSELDLNSEKFELEITESLLLENLHEAVPQLNMLKQSGVIISIDDFGTGYSSLSYLQHLPIDVLKIDRSFLAGVDSTSPGTIVNAIIELGRALNLGVVAEGIETEAQKQFLLDRGCVIHQGYLYDKPLSLEDIIERYKLKSKI